MAGNGVWPTSDQPWNVKWITTDMVNRSGESQNGSFLGNDTIRSSESPSLEEGNYVEGSQDINQ